MCKNFRTFIWDGISLVHEFSVTQVDLELEICLFAPHKRWDAGHRPVSLYLALKVVYVRGDLMYTMLALNV